MTDNRAGLSLITDILDVLDRHGYSRGDDEHAGQAILLIPDLADVYDGSLDHPFGPYINEIPPRAEPEPRAPAGHDAVTIPAGEVETLFAALDIAAACKRDRAAACTDCLNTSCLTCQQRLQDTHAYDDLAALLIGAAEESAAPIAIHPGPATQPQPAAEGEAGQ
jgi:hypothetical protein